MTDIRINLPAIAGSWSACLLRAGTMFRLSQGADCKGTAMYTLNIHVEGVDFYFVVRDRDEGQEAFTAAKTIQTDHDAREWLAQFLPRERLLDAMAAIAKTAHDEGREELRGQFRSLLLA